METKTKEELARMPISEFKEKVKYEGRKTEHSKKIVHNRQIAKISGKKRQSARNTLKQKIVKELDHED